MAECIGNSIWGLQSKAKQYQFNNDFSVLQILPQVGKYNTLDTNS